MLFITSNRYINRCVIIKWNGQECEIQIKSPVHHPKLNSKSVYGEGFSVAASVYKLKGWYLRLNTPLFPIHFRTTRAVPDIAFKVAPYATRFEILASSALAPLPACHLRWHALLLTKNVTYHFLKKCFSTLFKFIFKRLRFLFLRGNNYHVVFNLYFYLNYLSKNLLIPRPFTILL